MFSVSGDAASVSAPHPADGVLAVLAWVDEQEASSDPRTIPKDWVPGSSDSERVRLAALGRAVAAHLSRRKVGGAAWVAAIPAVASWLRADPSVPAYVANAIASVAAGGPDSVAQLYGSVVTRTARRHLGTFFTPSAEAEWMIERWDQLFGTPSSVVDVGAGVGVFTLRAHQQWSAARLVPVDVNPVTLGLLTVIGEGADDAPQTNRLEPHLGDYAAWSMSHLHTIKGPRLILGNPPYTRLQLIPRHERSTLLQAAGGLCGSRASLSALMLGTALHRLASEDGVCFLLPAQWLESDYADRLRQWLWDASSRRVELHLFDSQVFDDAQVDAVCLIVGPESATDQPMIFGNATSRDGQIGSAVRTVDRADDSPSNWRRMFVRSSTTDTPVKRTVPLSDFATVKRGVATGFNAFFTLSEETRRRYRLPNSAVRHYVQRPRDFGLSADVTDEDLNSLDDTSRRYMLAVPANPQSKGVRRYLEHGVDLGANTGYLAALRKCWYALGREVFMPELIIAASARGRFAVLGNLAGATIANNLYGLTWNASTPQSARTALTAWLRSPDGQRAITAASRTQADGLRKIEVRALAQLPIPSEVVAT